MANAQRRQYVEHWPRADFCTYASSVTLTGPGSGLLSVYDQGATLYVNPLKILTCAYCGTRQYVDTRVPGRVSCDACGAGLVL